MAIFLTDGKILPKTLEFEKTFVFDLEQNSGRNTRNKNRFFGFANFWDFFRFFRKSDFRFGISIKF